MSQLVPVSSVAPPAAEGLSTVPITDSSPPKPGELEEHMFLSSSIGGSKHGQATVLAEPAGCEESEEGIVEGSNKSTSPELRKENQRLEKENQQMADELSHLKGLCNNIFSMMSNYGPSGQQDPAGNMSMESKQLDLLQSGKWLDEQGGSSGGNAGEMDDKERAEEEDDKSPMLFGVSIGAKRRKRSTEDENNHKQNQDQQNEAMTESYSYSNTAHSEFKKEPGTS